MNVSEFVVSMTVAIVVATARFEYESYLMRKRKDKQLETQQEMLLELKKIRQSLEKTTWI